MSSTPEDPDKVFQEIVDAFQGPSAPEPRYPGMNSKRPLRRFIKKHRGAIAAITALNIVAAGIITDEAINREVPRDVVGEASVRALKDPQALRALGVCSSELLAEAELEQYRIGREKGSTSGITVIGLQTAAYLARTHNVSCVPTRKVSPATHWTTLYGGTTVPVHPNHLVTLDASDVCGLMTTPDKLAPPDPTDAQNYAALIVRVATRVANETNQPC